MFDITDGRCARVLDGHAEDAPADGLSQKQPPCSGLARRLAAASDPLAAAPSAVHRRRRILVVEDNLVIAELISERLQTSGYAVVGPASTLQAACALARRAEFDGAVLDLKLGEDLCLPIASILKARGIPFVVLTGYPVRLDFPAFEPTAWIAKPMRTFNVVSTTSLKPAAIHGLLRVGQVAVVVAKPGVGAHGRFHLPL